MHKNIKKLIIGLILFSVLVIFNPILAAETTGTYDFANNSGLNKTGIGAGYNDYLRGLKPESVVGRAVSLILTLLGVIFLGIMLYGGIVWMTASGKEQRTQKAKDSITAGVLGLVVVLIAYAISYFVVSYFSDRALVG